MPQSVMKPKLSRLLEPKFQLYLVCLLAFSAVTARFSRPVAAIEAACVVLLWIFHHENSRYRRKEIKKFIEHVAGNVETATRDTMINAPLPMVIFRLESGDIIWTNDRFLQLSGEQDYLFDVKLSSIVPGFDTRWLMEGKTQYPSEITYASRRFQVYGHLVRASDKGASGFMATTYWIDVTEYTDVRDRYAAGKPVAAVVLIDNYEDLTKNLTDNDKSAILAAVDARLDAWLSGTGSLLRRYQRERYILLLEEQYLNQFIEKKFEILDAVRQIQNSKGISASLSIGIGRDGNSFDELLQFANLSIDMALSRGGDQVVIRDQNTFEFYGGRSAETEKRTKVKSRVMANALNSLLLNASQVFVMGHKMPDMDVTGAAVGVCIAARKKDVPAYIIKEAGNNNPSKPIIDRLLTVPEYQDMFRSPQEAMILSDKRSLLVVVDTNRPEQVQSQELLRTCSQVAVIDHHRRAATYIEGAALNYHEPYASSASELVTELLQYLVEPAEIRKIEAEALLAGIVLDTKNFTMRTGARTFEAAAFLRRSGADTSEVKRLFQNDFNGAVAKYHIVQNAKIYYDHIAIAAMDRVVGRVTAAQAADELLNIAGIDASFVLYPDGERVNISGRSMGDINVQVILEKLGGGGNAAAAGGQVPDQSVEQVDANLKQAIEAYLADQDQ